MSLSRNKKNTPAEKPVCMYTQTKVSMHIHSLSRMINRAVIDIGKQCRPDQMLQNAVFHLGLHCFH